MKLHIFLISVKYSYHNFNYSFRSIANRNSNCFYGRVIQTKNLHAMTSLSAPNNLNLVCAKAKQF